MKIFGRYYVDQNFVTICSNGTIYTVARNSGQIGRVSIGEYMFNGRKLTQEGYDQIASKCNREKEFDFYG